MLKTDAGMSLESENITDVVRADPPYTQNTQAA